MQAVIEHGKIYIPEEIINKAHLPTKGKCEVNVIGNEVRITPIVTTPMKMIKILQESKVVVPIDKMVKNEVVDID